MCEIGNGSYIFRRGGAHPGVWIWDYPDTRTLCEDDINFIVTCFKTFKASNSQFNYIVDSGH